MARRYALRDDQWALIENLLPGREGTVGVTAKDNRFSVEVMLYRYRAGIPWRDLPERFGDFRVVHTRFSRWAKTGVWARIIEHLAQEYAMIVRAHQHSAGAQKKAAKIKPSAASTKFHATVDALGNPTGFHFTPGHAAHDLDGADALLPRLCRP